MDLTDSLIRARGLGDRGIESLLPAVYDELKRLAAGYLRSEREAHTLQPTALVHEAYLRLVGQDDSRWKNRAHFLGVAATAMRCVLVDHARAKKARKRGDGYTKVPLDEAIDLFEESVPDLVALDDALSELTRQDNQLGHIVELRFFAGLTIEETARVLRVSAPTIARGWRVARAWLRSELRPDEANGQG